MPVPLVELAHAALSRLADETAARGERRLPTERDLAERLGTSRTTVRKALEILEREGRIYRVLGRAGGAFLAPAQREVAAAPESAMSLGTARRLQRSLNTVKGVPEMLREQGFRYGTRVLSAQLTDPTHDAAAHLGVTCDERVVSLLRVRFADGDTLSFEHMFLVAKCAAILETPTKSVYRTLQTRIGVEVCVVDEAIELAALPQSVADLMGQPAGTPALRLERVGYDEGGRPVEYSVDLFRADRTRLLVRTRAADAARPPAIRDHA